MRLYWMRQGWAPNPMTRVLIKRGIFADTHTNIGKKIMWLWRQKLERYSYKPRNYQGLPITRGSWDKAKNGSSSVSPGGEAWPANTLMSDFRASQTGRKYLSVGWSHLLGGTSLKQPGKLLQYLITNVANIILRACPMPGTALSSSHVFTSLMLQATFWGKHGSSHFI